MRSNRAVPHSPSVTYEGHSAQRLTAKLELRRSVLASMLFESTYYETGTEHAKRIAQLVTKVPPEEVAALAKEARDLMYLRHAPLFLVRELARIKGQGRLVADTLFHIIQRPDELCEYLALYWAPTPSGTKKRPEPLSKGSQKGLARAFAKFSEYGLAKYDRDAAVKLRDVLRMSHPKPIDTRQAELWKRVIDRTLATPDTWEVELSAGKDKKATFERLIEENKLGGLAFLRNLRNMKESGVSEDLVRQRFLTGDFEKVLPFRFISAARYVPAWEQWIEQAMLRTMTPLQGTMRGKTALIIDTSPSMEDKLSDKSELTRMDAASALAILVREICEDVRVWAFNEQSYEVPARHGFALADALKETMGNYSRGDLAVAAANKWDYDRIIVLTDGQWHKAGGRSSWDTIAPKDAVPPKGERAYIINMATYKNGVGYGPWVNVDGWSERTIDFIQSFEADQPILQARPYLCRGWA